MHRLRRLTSWKKGGIEMRIWANRIQRGTQFLLVAGLVPLLAGCWGFTKTLHEAEAIDDDALRQAEIRPGETTRAEFLELIREPWVSSRRWRFDLHRVTDYDSEFSLAFFLYWPIFPSVERTDWESYLLVSWDDNDVVAAAAAGEVDRDDYMERGQLVLRAGGLTMAVDRAEDDGVALWVDPNALRPYLDERVVADACTLVLACDRGTRCPNRVRVDDGPPFDPGFIKLYCVDESQCEGAESDPTESQAAKTPVSWMLVLHPLDLAPGKHQLVLADRRMKGDAEITFSCQPGQVLFARVQGELVPGSFWSGNHVQPTAELVDSLPPEWSNYRVALWRSGLWLVVH
jgi:hypothetical protein